MVKIYQKIKWIRKVLLLVENPLEFVLTFFALDTLGAVVLPLYGQTGVNKVKEIISTYEINYFIQNCRNQEYGFEYEIVNFDEETSACIYNCSNLVDTELENTELILFSSGTTSMPKAIMLSYNNVKSNVQAISAYLNLEIGDTILLMKNLSHSSSIVGELLVGLYNGCTIVLNDKLPRTASILKLLSENKVSVFFAVPTILKAIMDYKKLDSYDLSKLRIINFYGAPMYYKDILKLIDILPQTNLIYSYGQTEASPRVTYIEKEDLLHRPLSSGKAIEQVCVEIYNEKNQKVAPMEIGEITVVGPNVMLGYYRNEAKTLATIKGNRLFTGDLGYMDEEGFLYVTGRKDNMIISAGKNIYLEEIENVLMSHSDISEAVVVGKKEDNETCTIIAYVVLSHNSTFDLQAIYEFCRDNLENYKIPKEVIQVKSLEKTASGKIRRNITN